MKAGVEPGARPRPLARCAAVGSTGSPLSPEGFDWVYDAARRGHLALLDQRRHRRLHRVRRRRARRCPSTAGELQAPRARRRRSRPWTRTATPSIGEVGELVITEPMPSMPVFFWGDDGRRALPRRATSTMYPGVWRHGDWIEITDARHRDHLRPLGLDDQPRRRPHGHERDLPRRARRSTRSSTRSSSTSRGAGTEGWMPLFVVLARGRRRSTTTSSRAITRAHPRGLLAAPRARTRSSQIAEVPRTLSRQGARGAGQADPDGGARRARREPRLARQPRGARLVRRLRARARSGRLSGRVEREADAGQLLAGRPTAARCAPTSRAALVVPTSFGCPRLSNGPSGPTYAPGGTSIVAA